MPTIALVGYTNAGKSAIMNLCTDARVESEDRLFQTLNTRQRQVRLAGGQLAKMLDTVGFITNLPHMLVDCFKSTLDELHQADVLVHVRDISHPHSDFQKQTVLKVMKEVGVSPELLSDGGRYLEVWNKVDLIDRDELAHLFESQAQHADYPIVLLSATEGYNRQVFIEELADLVACSLGKQLVELRYPAWEHHTRVGWLLKFANLSDPGNFTVDETGQEITIKAVLDEATYMKWIKEFESEKINF